MSSGNVSVAHAASGLMCVRVARTERVTPHMVRVTLTGEDLRRFQFQGFDQWFRLILPVDGEAGLARMPHRFDLAGYLRYLALPGGTRPVVRNYTVRAWRSDAGELDVDFVQHGDAGVAGPWAATAQAGAPVGLIDQGRGFEARPGDTAVLTGDESALPAIAGILRDLPSDARGDAIVELFDADDRQDLAYPAGVTVHWLTRPPDAAPGAAALPALRDLDLGSTPRGGIQAFAAGESALATAARRHLVNERGVPRSNVTFCGYWKWSQNA